MAARNKQDPAAFWRDYAAKLGEQVLAYALGQYLQGWDDFDTPLWGLLIATSGGFRFHHFPHESWLAAMSRTTLGGEAPQERCIFIPQERLITAELQEESSWWKKLFRAQSPRLVIRYRTAEGVERELMAETEKKAAALVQALGRNRSEP
ncbi:MAG: hypothetical protein LBQ30_10235 [Treponema sp.]|jgi:hypothetical protein|nr:hypothetical protein [Treponema sp.]